jgi:RNA polymerase sigma-70 factor (ECF subfamily)
MKNAADTEDAVADTFVKLLRSRMTFESEEHEKAWLIRTAANVCKDSLKHWWNKRESLTEYIDSSDTIRFGRTQSELSPELSTETDGVTDAVLALPHKYKSAVYLYYYEGYTTPEIAKMLKKPPSTIRNYLSEARQILKGKLGDYNE